MTYQILMTYCEPEQLAPGVDGHRLVRVPGSPTRPARPWETNTWWEDLTAVELHQIERRWMRDVVDTMIWRVQGCTEICDPSAPQFRTAPVVDLAAVWEGRR